MKKSKAVLFVSLAIGVAILAVLVLSPGTTAQSGASRGPSGDVVMLRCNSAGTDIPLSAFTRSTGAPTQKSSGCAQSLSLLMKDGFAIQDIGHYDDQKLGFIIVTLVR